MLEAGKRRAGQAIAALHTKVIAPDPGSATLFAILRLFGHSDPLLGLPARCAGVRCSSYSYNSRSTHVCRHHRGIDFLESKPGSVLWKVRPGQVF